MITGLIKDNFEYYIYYLKKLVAIPSVFSNPENIKKAIQFCKKVLEANLDNHKIYFDNQQNLIALPHKIDPQKDIIYLSAHIDTVDADPKEWDKPFHPWRIYENKNEIVARGASDCKAGVAYQLFLSYLAKKKLINLKNIVFTIIFKEEGAGKKTSKEIAKQIGKKLPTSNQSTYLIVLENNVIVKTKPILCIYTSERGNFVIKITDNISKLQEYFSTLEKWNPICINPEYSTNTTKWEVKKQKGGHACSVDRKNNLLTNIILNANDNILIKAGDESSFGIIPTKIQISSTEKPTKHVLVLSNRSFDSLNEVNKQLKGIKYKKVKDFSVSQGLDIDEKYSKNKISKIVNQCERNSGLKIKHTYNIGTSDASIIYSSLKNTKNIFPIIMGPGSRSQRNKSPQRLTHGKNETFDKESGKRAIKYITEVLKQLNCLE